MNRMIRWLAAAMTAALLTAGLAVAVANADGHDGDNGQPPPRTPQRPRPPS